MMKLNFGKIEERISIVLLFGHISHVKRRRRSYEKLNALRRSAPPRRSRPQSTIRAGAFSTYTDYRAALTTVLKKQLGVTLVVAVVVAWGAGGRLLRGCRRGRAAPRARSPAASARRAATSSAGELLPGDGTCRCRRTGHVTQHLEAPARREEAAMQPRKRDPLPSLGNELGSGTTPGRRRRRDRSRSISFDDSHYRDFAPEDRRWSAHPQGHEKGPRWSRYRKPVHSSTSLIRIRSPLRLESDSKRGDDAGFIATIISAKITANFSNKFTEYLSLTGKMSIKLDSRTK
ncbi:hypothetical protein TcasGA2_TC010118 [Tribolium castaneum]|uniref:Uncharacterized protein n=1 Tax=Tribolium castaneum TaxID=7070 RepID=D6WSM4_TRICA|nr:hypothetical protein TcasGA2_TC010118 [Tribolium castaneum]